MTPATEPTAAPIRTTMDKATATAWCRLVSEAIIGGKISVRFGDEAVSLLQADGFWDLASAVRSACYTREGLMRSRGFRGRS